MCLDVFVGYPDSKQLPVGVDDLSTIDAAPFTAGDDAVAVVVIGKQNTPCGSILLQETRRFAISGLVKNGLHDMENHHSQWEHQLFLWPFSIANC